MEEIDELVKRYHLEESSEYVIIPFTSADGRKKRCFLLKRRFIRIAFKDGHVADYPLAEAIEAVRNYPDMKLSEALYLMHKDDAEKSIMAGGEEQTSGGTMVKTTNE
jgi:hypothetical protein